LEFCDKSSRFAFRQTWEVFLSEQIAGMNDEALTEFLTAWAGVDLGGEPTIVGCEVQIFVNFGLEAK
jgi:hypothetical protein